MFRLISCILIIILASPAIAQDWKTLYDQAIVQFENGEFAEALPKAEKAYQAAATLAPKQQAYTLQLLTSLCLQTQEYDKGLRYSTEEVRLFKQLEGPQGPTVAKALDKNAQLLLALSRGKEACSVYLDLMSLIRKNQGVAGLPYVQAQANYGAALITINEFTKASSALDSAIAGLSRLDPESEAYGSALYYGAVADNKNKNFANARARLVAFTTLAEKKEWSDWPEYEEARKQLDLLGGNSSVSNQSPENQNAREHLTHALELQATQPQEAARYFDRAERSIAETGVNNNTGFSVYLNYGRFLLTNKQINEATSRLERARTVAASLYSKTGPEYGYLLELEADLQIASGAIQPAAATYEIALADLKSIAPDQLANRYLSASINLLNSNRSDLANGLIKQPATDLSGLGKLPSAIQVRIVSMYCESLRQLSRNQEAIDYLNKLTSDIAFKNIQKDITLNLAEAHVGAGNWQSAEALLVSLTKSTSYDVVAQSEAYFQLARLTQEVGKFREAEEYYQKAIAGFTQSHASGLNEANNSFATFYTTLGNYDAAASIYQRLLKDPALAPVLRNTVKQNLATLYEETLQYDEAEKILLEVLDSDRTLLGDKHPDYAVSLQNLATVYQATRDFNKAIRLYQQALEIDRINGGNKTLHYAQKEANLGIVYREAGELVKAKQYFESSLTILEQLLGVDHPDYMYVLYNVAQLSKDMGEPDDAKPLFRQVSTFYLKQIKELFPVLSDAEKTSYLNKIGRIIDDYEEFIIRFQSDDPVALGQLIDFRIETKALLLNASLKVRKAILSHGNADVQKKFTEWLQLKEKLAHDASLTVGERQEQQVAMDERRRQANETEKYLSAQSELFADEFSKRPITWQDIKKSLKPSEAAMELIRLNLGSDSVAYAAIVIRPEWSAPVLVNFKNGAQMEGREFRYYSNTIRFELENHRSYTVFWKPLESVLNQVSTLYFSADGIYNKINPLTLYDPGKGEYLVDRLTLHLLSNLREVSSRTRPVSNAPTASLFGYPDYQPYRVAEDDKEGSTRSSNLAEMLKGVIDLPGTKEEVISIEKLLKQKQWAVTSYLSKEATEARIKKMSSPNILHIATHGFFIREKDPETPIVYSHDLSYAQENPLTQSGLLLSRSIQPGSPQTESSEEDGVLTALEVMNLTLDHTDLVVLSACETGSGKIRNGEGVYGLQRAFLVAGANSLLMSLWKVSDDATEELMIRFYKNYLGSMDKATAFRRAQLDLKEKYKEPFYWGAFVLAGR